MIYNQGPYSYTRFYFTKEKQKYTCVHTSELDIHHSDPLNKVTSTLQTKSLS